MNDPARHRRIKELFLQVSQRPAAEQAACLDAACGDDRALRQQVEELLVAERARPQFLEESPVPRLTTEAPPLPERVGAFTIVRLLGEGGMGHVFEAEQQDPRRRVALKILRRGLALPKLLARFEQEKSLLARLQHPGIAQIFEAGTAEVFGSVQPYFAMELVAGVPVTAYVQAQALAIEARLELFVRICDAVQHAHQKGVIHRDLKPANILVTADGQPKVLDFGVARAADADAQLTTVGADVAQIIGTLPYMSPEQATGATEQVDARSDVYGLGVILYELLTDRLPYDVAATPLPEAVRIICERPPRPISALRRGLRGDLETIVGKALEKEKERRYASVNALAADVRCYLCDEPIEARPASPLSKLVKFARRNKLLVGLVAALIVALVAGLWLQTRFDREARQRQASERQRYRTLIAAAVRELEAGRRLPARRFLDEAPADLRDWEWRYLAAQLDESLQTLVGAGNKTWYAGFLHATGQALAVDEQSDVYLWERSSAAVTAVRLAPQPNEELESRRPLAISADGGLVLTRATIHEPPQKPRTVAVLWRSASGEVLQRFDVDHLVLDLMASAIAPTGAHVALATKPRLHLYEVASARRVEALPWAYGGSTFSADGAWLAYTSGKTVSFWDVAAGREARPPLVVAPEPDGSVSELALSADRSRLATGRAAGVEVWDVASGARRHVLRRDAGAVFQLAFSADGSALASNADLIRIWNPATGELLHSWAGGPGLCAGGFDADGRDYATGYREAPAYGVRLWNLTGRSSLVLEGHRSFVYPVAISANGTLIASGAGDGEIRLWEAATSRPVAAFAAHDGPVRGLAFDPGAPRLVSAADSVAAWDTMTGALLRRIDEPAVAVAFSPDGALLAVGHGGELEVLDGRSLERRAVRRAPCGVVTFSPDGRWLATAAGYGGNDTGIAVHDSGSLAPAFVLPTPTPVFSLGFSPDGAQLASGERSGKVTVWDIAARRRSGEAGHRGEVFAVRFVGDRRLASGGRDRTIRVWEVAAPPAGGLIPVVELRGHTNYVFSLALGPDGERLVSGSGDHTVRIWETQPIARRLAARRAAAKLPKTR